MKIITKRCTIRRFKDKDIDSFMIYRNNEHWMRYQGFKGLTKQAYSKELLRSPSFTKGMQLAIVNTTSDYLVGDIYVRREEDTFWLGYTISPEYARQGYAYEAITAVITWIKHKGINNIKAGVLMENIASINLLRKLNFTLATIEGDEQIYTLQY